MARRVGEKDAQAMKDDSQIGEQFIVIFFCETAVFAQRAGVRQFMATVPTSSIGRSKPSRLR